MTERDTIKAGEAAIAWLQGRLNERNAENERLRAALRCARAHVAATNDAEHMMDGFGGWRERPSDVDLSMIDDALGDVEQQLPVDEDDGDHRFSKDSYF